VSPQAPCPLCAGPATFAYEGRDRLHGVPGAWRYFRCPDCRSDFVHPMPPPQAIRAFYPPEYADHAPAAPRVPSAMRRAVLATRHGYRHLEAPPALCLLAPLVARLRYRDEVPWVRGGRALDVGCGSGGYLRYLSALGWDVEGVEPGPAAATAARAAGLRVYQGAFGEVPIVAGAFSLVTARHVIEHVPDPRPFLAEAARVLEPGGRLVLRTPNARALGRALCGADWYANDPPRHLVLYAARPLRRLLREAGFEAVTVARRTTPKDLLNTLDLRRGRTGTPSRRVRGRRLLARPYVLLARLLGRGDELVVTARKSRPG
jgi:SAM-dependent methyltransferase